MVTCLGKHLRECLMLQAVQQQHQPYLVMARVLMVILADLCPLQIGFHASLSGCQ